jgi:uncharacterized membrane protein YeaQ/YmgE (transglycosylase-associated protein family)
MDTNTIISLLVSLVAGTAGGNVVAQLFKNRNLTPMLASVLGAVGGGIGGEVLPKLIPAFGQLVGGTGYAGTGVLAAIVGAVLPLVVSFFRKNAVTA